MSERERVNTEHKIRLEENMGWAACFFLFFYKKLKRGEEGFIALACCGSRRLVLFSSCVDLEASEFHRTDG